MKDVILHFFQAKSFPELAEAVRARAAAVLTRWETASREILPAADELTHTQLRNSLPETLDNLARALESTNPSPTRALLTDSKEHGVCRFMQAYNLTELLIEFDVLRPILMEEAALHMKRDITLGEVIALNMGIDLAARRSVLAFVNHQRHELEAASNAHAKYLSFMSHDVRGGLNAILLSTEVLYQDLAGDPKFAEALEDLDIIKRNILHTVDTMDRFLHAEHLRSGKVTPKTALVDVRVLAEELAAQFKQQAAAKQISLRIEAPASCTVQTDRELVQTVLQNLLGNAVKYTPRGEVVVGIQSSPKGCIVWVKDQGPGIAPERLEQLFAPFVRGETHGQRGVGLGLYIARQASEVLGARLHAESSLGVGTTFSLHLVG